VLDETILPCVDLSNEMIFPTIEKQVSEALFNLIGIGISTPATVDFMRDLRLNVID
jgi:hypothetical protein